MRCQRNPIISSVQLSKIHSRSFGESDTNVPVHSIRFFATIKVTIFCTDSGPYPEAPITGGRLITKRQIGGK